MQRKISRYRSSDLLFFVKLNSCVKMKALRKVLHAQSADIIMQKALVAPNLIAVT